MKLDKKSQTKQDFIKFMEDNPELRFWQAVYAFSGYSLITVGEDKDRESSADPYYYEEKNK